MEWCTVISTDIIEMDKKCSLTLRYLVLLNRYTYIYYIYT